MFRQAADNHADWHLPELTSELAVIAKNERRFIRFSSDDSGFDPERHRGRVVVTTMHSRLNYVKERLRLLYVGITRAKRDLIVTWNSGGRVM